MQRVTGLIVGLFCFLFVLTTVVCAHDLNMTGVKILLGKSEVSVSVVAHTHNLRTGDASAEIADRLKLRLDGQPFSPVKAQLLKDPANGIVIWQAQHEGQIGSTPLVELDAPVFPEITAQSTVVTVFKDRQVLEEAVLDVNHPTAIIGKAKESNTWKVILRFAHQGVVHIFGGFDHVLFLLSLLLLGGTWKQLLKIVTAFTLAHSITLSLAATGVFSLPPRFVEPVIALSIVAVALANFRTPEAESNAKHLDFRPWMAFGFGLIHGFGFAGALSEIGLPRESLWWALLSFNVGVELGQVTLVLIFAPALAILAKSWPKLRIPMIRYGSVMVATIGVFWFVQRVLTA